MIFYSILSNIDEVLSSKPTANVLFELCYNFSISYNLTQMVRLHTWIPDCDSHSPALSDLFLSSNASICSTMAFPPLGNSGHVVVSVSTDFPINSKWDAPFHCIAYDYCCADWDNLCDHLRDVPWEDVLELSASAAASEFCECVQIGIDVYVHHWKYQVKPYPCSWFSAACAAAIVYRNNFFHLYQQNKSESKGKFRQATNCGKRVLEPAKLAYATKTKEPFTSQKLDSWDFW